MMGNKEVQELKDIVAHIFVREQDFVPLSSETQPLPDLVVIFISDPVLIGGASCVLSGQGIHYGTKVRIKNVGQARAGPFNVTINGSSQTVATGLEPGQEIDLVFPQGGKRVMVDQTSLVEENKEDNNEVTEWYVATPSPPPTCTLTPSPTAATPTPTMILTATSSN